MVELLLSLESEEIPASMQKSAAERLAQTLIQRLESLNPRQAHPFWGPMRIGLGLSIDAFVPASTQLERGPRTSAPVAAVTGFLRKFSAMRADLFEENGFWVLQRHVACVSAADCLSSVIPDILWAFAWPKSMRWGQGSQFTWVRPLRRIVATLDGTPLPFQLARGDDLAHGLTAANLAKGHRFLSPAPFNVTTLDDYRNKLVEHHVILEADARREIIREGICTTVNRENLSVVEDEALLEELCGLTEWPKVMLGQIDPKFMQLPAEVMQVSMRVNQRYFATRDADGRPAPYFVFVANQTFPDDGVRTAAGNARVLRARFADAWHFWSLDRQTPLSARVEGLSSVTFHQKLGSVGARVQRLVNLAQEVAQALKMSEAVRVHAGRAAYLCKADLTTGMVAEFPELQGIMGGYYALHDGEDEAVAEAIAKHYQPRGLQDATPRTPAAICVALADRLDVLSGFFAVGEIPTGSGDPYALRRAALGIIRIIRDNSLTLDLQHVFTRAVCQQPVPSDSDAITAQLLAFVSERLRIQLRQEGQRYDVLTAVITPDRRKDVTDLLARSEALATMLATEDGASLLSASKRANNILRIENKKDGPHQGAAQEELYRHPAEATLAEALAHVSHQIDNALVAQDYTAAMREAATLRAPLDAFFEHVTINDPDAALRKNRLYLLNQLDHALSKIAAFSMIDG